MVWVRVKRSANGMMEKSPSPPTVGTLIIAIVSGVLSTSGNTYYKSAIFHNLVRNASNYCTDVHNMEILHQLTIPLM